MKSLFDNSVWYCGHLLNVRCYDMKTLKLIVRKCYGAISTISAYCILHTNSPEQVAVSRKHVRPFFSRALIAKRSRTRRANSMSPGSTCANGRVSSSSAFLFFSHNLRRELVMVMPIAWTKSMAHQLRSQRATRQQKGKAVEQSTRAVVVLWLTASTYLIFTLEGNNCTVLVCTCTNRPIFRSPSDDFTLHRLIYKGIMGRQN
ncbi:hypothetical protein DFH11DRAFT_893053 [Phellopilus nigrolimitatus]|nr:hypothetical protein DFH11DRAFT_893053 [Phellopilus nigrolimitatus]